MIHNIMHVLSIYLGKSTNFALTVIDLFFASVYSFCVVVDTTYSVALFYPPRTPVTWLFSYISNSAIVHQNIITTMMFRITVVIFLDRGCSSARRPKTQGCCTCPSC